MVLQNKNRFGKRVISEKDVLFWSKLQALPGEKLDKPGNLKKSIKTGRPDSPVTLGGLISLPEILTKIIYENNLTN